MPPTALFYTAGETPRAPRAPSLVVICDLVLMQCLLGSRPCGRLQPSTTWRSHERRCLNELICLIAACGTFHTAGETPRAPRAPSLVVICDLVLMQCLLGSRPCARLLPSTTWRAHERRCLDGLICPNAACGTFYTAGETPRAPRAPSLVVICDLVLMQCLLGSRPCGRLLPSTTWRAHERRCLNELICLIAACGTFHTAGETPRAPRAKCSSVV